MAAPTNNPGDTIFALSSGALPSAIAIIRISGPLAGDALRYLAGALPEPRRAMLRTLRDPIDGDLDHALVLWMPGPSTVTGEDIAELHLHGGRAVVAAVDRALCRFGLRMAEPGEFTRRALFNGRMDLSKVEGLADLLAAETENQRRDALRRTDGAISRLLDGWLDRLTDIAARIEAAIDYDGEEETGEAQHAVAADIAALLGEMERILAIAPAERLRDGIRVAIVGPPNAGKSTLFNALVGRDAAIVSDIAGTTRDAIERPVAIGGIAFVLIDTAGLRDALDPIERIGVERAQAQRSLADIVLDLSADALSGGRTIAISAKADTQEPRASTIPVSAPTGQGIAMLQANLTALASTLLPRENEISLDRRYREAIDQASQPLRLALDSMDSLILAEHVRDAIRALDRILGRDGTEDMLDALFSRFCLGK